MRRDVAYIISPEEMQCYQNYQKQKPHIYNYSLHGHELEPQDSAKYRGVIIISKIAWNDQTNKTCKKANYAFDFSVDIYKYPKNTLNEMHTRHLFTHK